MGKVRKNKTPIKRTLLEEELASSNNEFLGILKVMEKDSNDSKKQVPNSKLKLISW